MDNKYKNKSEGITTYKVGKLYRKNGLSLSDGGETVCVKFVGNYRRGIELVIVGMLLISGEWILAIILAIVWGTIEGDEN